MRIHFSQDADALYIRLKEDTIQNTDEISDDIIFDFNSNGDVIGIEILSASKKTDLKELIIQAFDRVMVENPASI